jgi:hypothetical protein
VRLLLEHGRRTGVSHILRDPLRKTTEAFRDVIAGRATDEGAAEEDQADPIPGWLVTRLLYTVGAQKQSCGRCPPVRHEQDGRRTPRGEG